MKYFSGIDPGAGGAIAIISEDLQMVEVWDFPGSVEAAANLLRSIMLEHHPALTCIEKVASMPKQGVASTFRFGQNFGGWIGALAALQVPFITATPSKWQKAVLDSGTGDTKQRSLSMARRVFPTIDLSRNKDHGRSDALLLGLYARNWHQNN